MMHPIQRHHLRLNETPTSLKPHTYLHHLPYSITIIREIVLDRATIDTEAMKFYNTVKTLKYTDTKNKNNIYRNISFSAVKSGQV
jgi:hypothetical protein